MNDPSSPHADRVSRYLTRVAQSAVIALVLVLPQRVVHAQECQVVSIDMTPSDDLQIVVWLEDEARTYIDTVFITQLTGTYGLGNRPGMMTFNSGWRWPYGRRTTTFPVWAHRHGMTWPMVVFQNGDDTNLSHPLGQSSDESFYCRPLREDEPMWDSQSCATVVYTDKGKLADTETSRYPPRADIAYTDGVDDMSILQYSELNPFDVVSRPTPSANMPFRVLWPIPENLPEGNYVIWVEVGKEFDTNEHFNYGEPVGIPWSEYGIPYRGQPSVVYSVPFTIGSTESVASTMEYVGYGDPDGLDGDLNPPDYKITTGVDGSGASRLVLTVDGSEMYRVRVSSRPTMDNTMPGAAEELQAVDVTSTAVQASFVAPADDGERVAGYEIRYMIGTGLTEENFAAARLATSVSPDDPGQVQLFTINDLTPRTEYSIGVRAFDECRNYGPLQVVQVVTPERELGDVGWCFVATAAYGSGLEQDVTLLRRFRDRFLRTHVPGELLVEGYYTFAPALARLIEPSETLRRAARVGLAPLVGAIRELSPEH